MEINYQKFIQYVHQQFENAISIDELERFLSLEEDYNKDNPTSIGKYLTLTRLVFTGEKNISHEKFTVDQKFNSGINIWIADNLKGKSTIFKIVKFALTGADSIKPDIKPWIKEILLEFKIGELTYTSFIDRRGRDRGALYSFGIDKFFEFRQEQKLDTIEREKEFDFKSKQELEEKIQDFFFDQFAFYTLKYTQKNPSKDNLELITSNLSWTTYFKSIYLESSNYEYLFFDNEKFGAQGRKIFEMVLGLPLTYPINMLSVRRDRVLDEIAQLKLIDKSKTETSKTKKESLEKKYIKVKEDLEVLRKGSQANFNDRPLIEEYNNIITRVNENQDKQRIAKEAYQNEKNKQLPLEEEIRNLETDKAKIENEINKLSKQELNVETYKEAGSFFSNLDIKTCPHCETDIHENKRVDEDKNHICSLCGEISLNQKTDEGELVNKLNRIREEKKSHSDKLQEINLTIKKQNDAIRQLKQSIADHYSKIVAIPSTETDTKRLKEIETQVDLIRKERNKNTELLKKNEELIKQEAILNFQLEEIKKENTSNNSEVLDKLNLKKAILDEALNLLEKKRIQLNNDILAKLELLILNEVQAFGLESIKKVEINEKYDLVFTQNEVQVSFKELVEGEKLRVKLAFYLSLIQLDIEHNLGRHPRFLIFDSPGSEEMVPKHLHGLSDFLKSVNTRFKDQLQIFVGSALREFSQITEPEKTFIKNEDEYMF